MNTILFLAMANEYNSSLYIISTFLAPCVCVLLRVGISLYLKNNKLGSKAMFLFRILLYIIG
ncbi:MAG: hypothetical protein ACRDCS_09750, partial [Tannerellaceae bacterium]